jgi:hypothetical protein
METGNNQYLIIVSGEKFEEVQVQEVLPAAFVESAKAGNNLARRIILLWLRHSKSGNPQFARLGMEMYLWSNFDFIVKERNV